MTGLILAGGRGARVGGRDKGLIERAGQPLAARARDALRPQVAALMLSANRNLERYRELVPTVVTDSTPAFDGPLAGLLAGLQGAATPWLLGLPCDTDQVPDDLAQRLLDDARSAGRHAAYAVDAEGPQYATCLLHRDLAPALAGALEKGHRAVRDFLAAQSAVAVAFDGCRLGNGNTPEALAC